MNEAVASHRVLLRPVSLVVGGFSAMVVGWRGEADPAGATGAPDPNAAPVKLLVPDARSWSPVAASWLPE